MNLDRIPKIDMAELVKMYCERQDAAETSLTQRLLGQINHFPNLEGWMLLECQVLDSSSLGRLFILPYGEGCTFKKPPLHPISMMGLASMTSVVIRLCPRAKP